MPDRFRGSGERAVWVAYGIALAAALSGALGRASPTLFTCQRVTDIERTIAALNHGLPPLTAMFRGAGGGLYPPGYGDDTGPYLVVPLIAHLFGTTSAVVAWRWLFVALFALVIALYPLIFRTLLESRSAAVAAPVALVLLILHLPGNFDQYWIEGWAMVLGVPLALLAWRERRSWRRGALLLATVVVAGFAQLMRSGSGYGVLIAILIVLLAAKGRCSVKLVLVLAVLVVFYGASTGVLDAATAYRNGQIGNRPLAAAFRSEYGGSTIASVPSGAHPLWHTVYIGLGYLPNRYGIYYGDRAAHQYVLRVDPRARYLSTRYSSDLERHVLHLLVSDPGFVVGTEMTKAGVALSDAIDVTGWLLLAVAILLCHPAVRRRLRRTVILTAPSVIVLWSIPVVSVPSAGYELGFYAALRFLVLLVLLAAAASAEAALASSPAGGAAGFRRYFARRLAPYIGQFPGWDAHESRPSVLQALRTMPPRLTAAARRTDGLTGVRASTALMLILAIVVAAGVAGAEIVKSRDRMASFYSAVTYLEPTGFSRVSGSTRGWSAGPAGLTGWTSASVHRPSVARVRADARLTTSASSYAYQLVSPFVTLPRGTYQLLINGRVARGGMTELVVDPAGRALAERTYSYRSAGGAGSGPAGMAVAFELHHTATVRFVLANYSPGSRSQWLLRGATLGSTPTLLGNDVPTSSSLAACTPPQPLSDAAGRAAVRGVLVARWPAASHGHVVWSADNGARVTPDGSDLKVSTSAEPYAYQVAGPLVRLEGGTRYELSVPVGVDRGGITILLVDSLTGSPVATVPVGETLTRFSDTPIRLEFTPPVNELVRAVMANNNPAGTSVWHFGAVSLRRL